MNLLDTSYQSKKEIMRPYVDLVKKESSNREIDESFADFFLTQMSNCICMLEEHEEIPDWVEDKKAFRLNSELLVFKVLFSSINFPSDSFDMQGVHVEFMDDIDDEDFFEDGEGEGIIEFEMNPVDLIFANVREFGLDRGWDLNALQILFLKSIGNDIQTHLLNSVKNRDLTSIDYN